MVKRAMKIADTKKSSMKYNAKFTWQQYQSRGVQYPLKSLTTPRRWFPNILWMDTRSSHKSMLKKKQILEQTFCVLSWAGSWFSFPHEPLFGKKMAIFVIFFACPREDFPEKTHTFFSVLVAKTVVFYGLYCLCFHLGEPVTEDHILLYWILVKSC